MTKSTSTSGEFCIAVTGLPGSGKSTLGQQVAALFDIPLLDKDNYLESLFEGRGTGGPDWRQPLSRESDPLFQQDAESLCRVVLVSHWRPLADTGSSGTPSNWLAAAFPQVIELFCHCPVEEAMRRFKARLRHPGHADGARTRTGVESWMHEYARHLPLSLGELVRVDTGQMVDQALLYNHLCEAINV